MFGLLSSRKHFLIIALSAFALPSLQAAVKVTRTRTLQADLAKAKKTLQSYIADKAVESVIEAQEMVVYRLEKQIEKGKYSRTNRRNRGVRKTSQLRNLARRHHAGERRIDLKKALRSSRRGAAGGGSRETRTKHRGRAVARRRAKIEKQNSSNY